MRDSPPSTGPDYSEPIGIGYVQWLCIQNPGDNDANVKATFYPESSSIPACEYSVKIPAGTRVTVFVNYYHDVTSTNSCYIQVISGPGVIAERPMYFNL